MPSSPLLPANLQLLLKHTRRRRDDVPVAGQPPHLLAFLYQCFVWKSSDELAVFLRIKLLESDGTVQENTHEWNVEEGIKILTRARPLLLVSQGGHGVDAHRPTSGNVACEQCHTTKEQRDTGKGERISAGNSE